MLVSVKNKRELFDLIIAHQEIIRTYGVRKLGVFGSFARNQANENSDIDFFINFYPHEKSFKKFMRLADFLEELTGRNIEIITPQSLNPFIGKYILKEVEYVSFAA